MSPNTANIPAVDQQVLLRRADADDAGMVFSYWLRDHFEHSAFASGITKSTYMKLHHLLVERIIARSIVWVACDAEDPTIIYGFICAEGASTLHYLFVKRRFRGLGIAHRLLNEAGLADGPMEFTHLTDAMVSLRKRWPLAEYNPYLI